MIIRPQDLSLRVNELSEKIIYGIMRNPEVEILGLNSAVFLACSAVNMATDIANVTVNEICLDYVKIPIFGEFEAILIKVGKKPTVDRKKRVKEEEKGMILSTGREGQIVAVRREERIERVVTLCLLRFQSIDKIKIIAAGRAINDAVSLALKLTEGEVAKEPVAINFIDLYTILSREDPTKKITGISIYLEKGRKTDRPAWHGKFIKKLKAQRKF